MGVRAKSRAPLRICGPGTRTVRRSVSSSALHRAAGRARCLSLEIAQLRCMCVPAAVAMRQTTAIIQNAIVLVDGTPPGRAVASAQNARRIRRKTLVQTCSDYPDRAIFVSLSSNSSRRFAQDRRQSSSHVQSERSQVCILNACIDSLSCEQSEQRDERQIHCWSAWGPNSIYTNAFCSTEGPSSELVWVRRPHKAAGDDACDLHRARRTQHRSSSTSSSSHASRGYGYRRGSWSRRRAQHVVRRRY